MNAKALLYAAVVAVVSLSCTREAEESGLLNSGIEMEFTAEWVDEKGADSRTVLQEDGTSIWWSANEEINVFIGKDVSAKFISTNSQPQGVASFVGNVLIGVTEQSNPFPGYWAAYPYNEENSCDGEGITMSLPYIQEGKANGFADKFFPAVACGDSYSLAFYNVCGGARFSVTQEGVTKVVFKSNDGSPMAGKVKVGFAGDNKPQILEFTEPVDSIVVNAPEGGFIPGTNYFAAMLPQAHVKGMTISLSTQDKKAIRTLDNAVTVHRSSFGILDNLDEGLQYLKQYAVPEVVDLGLSVKWASFNLGATKPEEYGNYFAWGETEPKEEYTWVNYKFRTSGDSNDNVKFSKYNTNSSYGPIDNKTLLDPEDDAAAVNLGGSWRIATYAEWDELKTKCTWTWTTQNGVNGRLITGPNGNSIFLPAAGYRNDTSLSRVGSYGLYWSSSLKTYYPDYAFYEGFDSSGEYCSYSYRCGGRSIRPVYRELVHVTGVELNESSLQLEKGATVQLIATITPEDASSKRVLWSNSKKSVATVSGDGVVSGVGVGTAEITATTVDGGYTATCTISVIPATPEAVDLGLPSGLKWASFNLGATKPEEYGDYFAWGETETKLNCSWFTYKWCKGGYNQLTKYCNYSSYGYKGFTDNKTVLAPEDDAAAVALGGSWRMPTKAEQDELRSQCTWTLTTNYNGTGVNGRLVTGPNGNSIFLPAAGYLYGAGLSTVGSYGRYWSSSLPTDDPSSACSVYFYSSFVDWYRDGRCDGLSIRPVTE